MPTTKVQTVRVIASLVAVLCLLAGVPRLLEELLTGHYATFSREAFERLQPGDELRTVTNALGAPISFIVIPAEQEKSSNTSLCRTNMAELIEFTARGRDLVLMKYSQPRWLDQFKAYEVFIKGGKVVEKRSYWYWD